MSKKGVSLDYPLRKAAAILARGGVIAYPTEGVWGLGCLPGCPAALDRILQIKGRDAAKGLILVASGLEQLRPYLAPLPDRVEARMQQSWPGPVTWVAPAAPDVPWQVTGGRGTVAVRVPDHDLVRRLCELAGSALVSTSANRSGQPPAPDLLSLRIRFAGELDYIVPGSLGSHGGPSEIRDALSGAVLRPAHKGRSS